MKIKWKKTSRYEYLSNQGHKALERVIYGQSSIYTVFTKSGIKLGSTTERSKINQLTMENSG